jgi:hypothetical protein
MSFGRDPQDGLSSECHCLFPAMVVLTELSHVKNCDNGFKMVQNHVPIFKSALATSTTD